MQWCDLKSIDGPGITDEAATKGPGSLDSRFSALARVSPQSGTTKVDAKTGERLARETKVPAGSPPLLERTGLLPSANSGGEERNWPRE